MKNKHYPFIGIPEAWFRASNLDVMRNFKLANQMFLLMSYFLSPKSSYFTLNEYN